MNPKTNKELIDYAIGEIQQLLTKEEAEIIIPRFRINAEPDRIRRLMATKNDQVKSDYLSYAFYWTDSVEGDNYWRSIHVKMTRREES